MSADNNTDDHRRHYDPDEDDSAVYSNGNDHPSVYRNSYNDTEDQYSNDKSDYYQAPEQYPTQKPSVYDTDHDYDDAVDNNTYHTGNDNNTYRNDNNTYHNNDSDTYYNENDNTPQYRDDRQYDDYRDDNNNDDDEQNALFRPRDGHDPHQKTTCGQKMKRCCQTCHQPKCQYRGPWYVRWERVSRSIISVSFSNIQHERLYFEHFSFSHHKFIRFHCFGCTVISLMVAVIRSWVS